MSDIAPNPRAVVGDNVKAYHEATIADLAGRLAALGDINADNAPKVRDVMKLARDTITALDEERADLQKPAEEVLKEIRSTYRVWTDKLTVIGGDAKRALTAHLLRVDEEQRQAAALAAQKAAEAQAEATARMNLADGGDVFDRMDAADAVKIAAELHADAEHAARMAEAGPAVNSATGISRAAGLRTTWTAEAEDPVAMVKALAKNPDVQAAALKVASAMMRSTKGTVRINGVRAKEVRTAT